MVMGLIYDWANRWVWMAIIGAAGAGVLRAGPDFFFEGHESEAARLTELLALHAPQARTECTLWDPWLPMATVWAATGAEPSAREAREFYRRALLRKRMDDDGYVAMQQHRGMAHSDGWPFPAWQQSTGKGWHFSLVGEEWAVQNFRQPAVTSLEGWEISGAEVVEIDPAVGLKVRATEGTVTLTTPAFSCGTVVAPFIRVEWGVDRPGAGPGVLGWMLDGQNGWRGAEFPLPSAGGNLTYANVPVHRQAGYDGLLTRLRVVVPVEVGSLVTLKSLITAIDTRHPVTNSAFLQAASDYFNWTTDVEFLRAALPRMRRALAYLLEEFEVRSGNHVRVSWVGHDGRTGLARDAAGARVLRPGLGVGNNYWDLLPFGGHDAMATMQAYVALRRMAALERVAAAHPEWQMGAAPATMEAEALETLARAVRIDFQTRFWDAEAGRFIGWIALDGSRHDFGFTFLNTEAIHHGLATSLQEKTVFEWLDGSRVVNGDTSQREDIYRWRFGPRSTTRRNTENYVWAWSAPESIGWGDQVQDGGAVLGFTYFELMARLRALGPDDAWLRLRDVLGWFGEVQAAGGYRSYYAEPGRGTLQGGGPPGGLGFDHEFMESVMVPSVVIHGFLGVVPEVGGFALRPRLPSGVPRLGVSGLHVQDCVFDVMASHAEIELVCRSASEGELILDLPAGPWDVVAADGAVEVVTALDGADGAVRWRLRWLAGQKRIFRRR